MYDLTNFTRPNGIPNPDFEAFKREIGVTEDQLFDARMKLRVPEKLESEAGVEYEDSAIHGQGVFTTDGAAFTEQLAPIIVKGQWTLTGLMINHSSNPNCKMAERLSGDVWLEAKESMAPGTELTIDYREQI